MVFSATTRAQDTRDDLRQLEWMRAAVMAERPLLCFVSPRFLFPADSGGKIRTTQILRGLKGDAFRIRLLMPATQTQCADFAADIDRICDEVVTWATPARSSLEEKIRKISNIFSKLPVPVAIDRDPDGARVVARELALRPDIIVFDFPHSVVLAPGSFDCRSVIFTHNVEAEIFERHWQVAPSPVHAFVWRSQYRKMRAFERAVLARFDRVVAVSERDAEYFRAEYGVGTCRTIPTGVDTDFFSYTAPRGDAQVVFCGSMDWMANIDGIGFFFDEVWPAIRRRVPGARMKVVGRTPPDALVRRIAAVADDWEFTGFVDDVRPHIAGADAFVIPLRVGGGTRIKAFEAMAMGSPVVSTGIGVEGLAVEDGRHYLRADAPGDFAERVVDLLTNGEQRLALAAAARELVVSSFGCRVAANAFESICSELLAAR